MKNFVIPFAFGAAIAIFGFPITTYQYWVLLVLFIASRF